MQITITLTHTQTCTESHNRFIPDSQKVETTPASVSRRMDKHTVGYSPYRGARLSDRKTQSLTPAAGGALS